MYVWGPGLSAVLLLGGCFFQIVGRPPLGVGEHPEGRLNGEKSFGGCRVPKVLVRVRFLEGAWFCSDELEIIIFWPLVRRRLLLPELIFHGLP